MLAAGGLVGYGIAGLDDDTLAETGGAPTTATVSVTTPVTITVPGPERTLTDTVLETLTEQETVTETATLTETQLITETVTVTGGPARHETAVRKVTERAPPPAAPAALAGPAAGLTSARKHPRGPSFTPP